MKSDSQKQPADLNRNKIIGLLKSSDNELFIKADSIRKNSKGDFIHLRALIEFTNICKCNCFYCGLRCGNKKVKRYRLTENEILECTKKAVDAGLRTIVLQGGEDSYWTQDKLCRLIDKIKKYDVALTLSIGERSYDEYKAFKEAGADRYLLRIETTDKNLYKSLHPNMDFENRLRCLKYLKSLGFETGTGCLVGLPGQTIDSLANDILFFKELNADMIGIGPFIPHPDTPLANANKDNFNLALRVMAIARIMIPDANIPATTAMETLKENGRIIALNSGANVIMPNFTDIIHKKNYEIYPNKNRLNDSPDKCISYIKLMIEKIGRKISMTKGFRKDNS